MKVFVATVVGPDSDDDDFSYTVEGELVTVAVAPCDDHLCGCRWSMAGVGSARATSVFAVADLPITRSDYVAAVRDGLIRQGWLATDHICDWFPDFVQMHIEEADTLPVGVPLRVLDEEFSVRRRRAA